MQVSLVSTTKIVDIVVGGNMTKARIWEGTTANGVPCHAYIVRIAVDKDDDSTEFERELVEHAPPSPAIESIPLRMII